MLNPFQHSHLAGFFYLHLEHGYRLQQDDAGELACTLAEEVSRVFKIKLIRDEGAIHQFIRRKFPRQSSKKDRAPRRRRRK